LDEQIKKVNETATTKIVIAMNTRIEEPFKPVILSAAKNLKTRSFAALRMTSLI